MESDPRSPAPACSLGQRELTQRAALWNALAARAAGQVSATESGARLVFDAGQGIARELRELVALERRCCAFATWAIQANGDQVAVEISADSPEGAAAVLAFFHWPASPA